MKSNNECWISINLIKIMSSGAMAAEGRQIAVSMLVHKTKDES
jgi:hypothetical protein